jgi:hypothetical protein
MKKVLAALGIIVGCGAACVTAYILYKKRKGEPTPIDSFEDFMLHMANSNGSYDYVDDEA